ncbi:hypothetical protein Tco_1088806, partial [Tanacetum coccineum]
DSDSDVEEDNRSSNEFLADLNVEFYERALLANQKRYYKRSGRVESARKPMEKSKETCFAYGKLEDKPSVGKADARSGQWVEITMKKVHRLLSMTDDDTCCKVTLDQLISEQVLGNIVQALGGKGRRKERTPCQEEPLSPLPKLIGVDLIRTSNSLISLADLTTNMAELTLNTSNSKKKNKKFDKVSTAYVIKKKTENKPHAEPKSCSDKKADSSTEQLLLTFMEEVKGLKDQTKIPSGTSPSDSQSSSLKSTKLKTRFGPCKHCGLRNHLIDDCYSKPK